jgi:hypothetical protein
VIWGMEYFSARPFKTSDTVVGDSPSRSATCVTVTRFFLDFFSLFLGIDFLAKLVSAANINCDYNVLVAVYQKNIPCQALSFFVQETFRRIEKYPGSMRG